MKKQPININYSWPAQVLDFSTDKENENFSRGKLKVFFEGTTPDKRYFSKEFSTNLVKTLPYTPIVSYYDEEKDDFVGHASEQNIYGIVDPCSSPTIEKGEDGNLWYVCDTVYYTQRPDQVGKIAKKIEGHSQSLELDPTSVKYVINYDEKMHLKNIEFTAGKFVGVSVLGKDQKPAFTGSQFFTDNEEFEEKMQILRDYCEGKQDQTQNGGEKMNLLEFVKLSWGEKTAKVSEKIANEYQNDAYTYVVDAYDDCVIMGFYYYVEGSLKTMRIYYSLDENNEVTLGKIEEVHITYEVINEVKENIVATNVENTDMEQASNQADAGLKETNAEEKKSENEDEDEDKSDKEDESKEDEENCSCSKDDDKKKENCESSTSESETINHSLNESADQAQVNNVDENNTPVDEKVSVDNEQESNKQEDSSSASFTESERTELEALKREKKITLVNSYKDSLSEEEINSFIEKIDSFEDIKDLELELLKAYKASSSEQRPMRAFALAPINNAKKQDSVDAYIQAHLRK